MHWCTIKPLRPSEHADAEEESPCRAPTTRDEVGDGPATRRRHSRSTPTLRGVRCWRAELPVRIPRCEALRPARAPSRGTAVLTRRRGRVPAASTAARHGSARVEWRMQTGHCTAGQRRSERARGGGGLTGVSIRGIASVRPRSESARAFRGLNFCQPPSTSANRAAR